MRALTEEADHSKAAVVDLGDQTLGLLLGRLVLGELERVEQVERHRVRQLVERREVARLAWWVGVGVKRKENSTACLVSAEWVL